MYLIHIVDSSYAIAAEPVTFIPFFLGEQRLVSSARLKHVSTT